MTQQQQSREFDVSDLSSIPKEKNLTRFQVPAKVSRIPGEGNVKSSFLKQQFHPYRVLGIRSSDSFIAIAISTDWSMTSLKSESLLYSNMAN